MYDVNTGIPCFLVLCFVMLYLCYSFYKLKVCGNPALSKSISAVFPTVCAHFTSLCHILVIIVFQNFFMMIISVMVICD